MGLLLLDVMLAAQLRGQPLGWLLMLAAQLLKHFQGGLVAWVAANRVQRGVTLMGWSGLLSCDTLTCTECSGSKVLSALSGAQ